MQEKFTIIHNILSLFGFFHLFPLYSAEKVPLSHSPQMQTLPPPHWFPGLAVFLPFASILSAYGSQMEIISFEIPRAGGGQDARRAVS